jgi:hypothetical protein
MRCARKALLALWKMARWRRSTFTLNAHCKVSLSKHTAKPMASAQTSTVTSEPLILAEQKMLYNYKIPGSCVAKFMRTGDVIRYLACGSNSCAFLLCDASGQCKSVIKILEVDENDDYNQRQAKREVKITKLMGEHHIGPKVLADLVCEGEYREPNKTSWRQATFYFIIMTRMDISLKQYRAQLEQLRHRFASEERIRLYEENIDEAVNKAIELDRRMWKLGYDHGDQHADNLLMNLDAKGRLSDVCWIDFGITTKEDPRLRTKDHEEKLVKLLREEE